MATSHWESPVWLVILVMYVTTIQSKLIFYFFNFFLPNGWRDVLPLSCVRQNRRGKLFPHNLFGRNNSISLMIFFFSLFFCLEEFLKVLSEWKKCYLFSCSSSAYYLPSYSSSIMLKCCHLAAGRQRASEISSRMFLNVPQQRLC